MVCADGDSDAGTVGGSGIAEGVASVVVVAAGGGAVAEVAVASAGQIRAATGPGGGV